jgi:hypothetical protein
VANGLPGERELQEEIARLDASITVLERVEVLGDRARADLEATRRRRMELAAALAAMRGDTPE